MAQATVKALYRYPVKGFSPEPLERTSIAAGETVPFDRAFAIENGPSGFNPAAPAYFQKSRFLMLMRDERIALFTARFDASSSRLQVFRDGLLQVEGTLATEDGRAPVEAWLAETFREELRGPPRILSAPGHSFSDVSAKVLHLVNLETIRALSKTLGREINPLRFRPNIVIDGVPAWQELQWEGAELQLPDARFTWMASTARCAAVNVDPVTAARDMDIPRSLRVLNGHADFGIYIAAQTDGSISVGESLEVRSPQ